MINVGFLGAGDIAGVHAAAIEQIAGARLVVVADINPKRAQSLAGKYRASALPDLEALLNFPALDVIYILTPPQDHGQQIIATAKAGLPVVCEKPLTVTLSEADQAIAAANEAGVPLMTGLSHRFHPLATEAKALLQNGDLGDLIAIWSHRFIHLPVDPASWLNDLEAGGGITLQYAMHDLDWECWLGGEVAQVTAQEAQADPKLDIADNLWALLQFRHSGNGSVGVSWSVPSSHTERGVIGSRGNLRILDQKRLVGKDVEGRRFDRDLGDNYDWFDVFVRENQDIVDRLKRGQPFSVTGEDGRQALEISLAVQKAAQTRQAVHLPLTEELLMEDER